MTAGLKILTGILLVLISFSFFSCGSKKLILEKHGVSYDGKDGQVVSYQDLRRLYDAQSYQTLYDLLEPVPEMNIEDYFIHFLLIQSGFSSSGRIILKRLTAVLQGGIFIWGS